MSFARAVLSGPNRSSLPFIRPGSQLYTLLLIYFFVMGYILSLHQNVENKAVLVDRTRHDALIDALSVNSITNRSIPMPRPPAGGMPYSSARM